MIFLAWAMALLPAAPPVDFNRDIRPILSENCFYCHGQDANKRKGDLRLDVRQDAVKAGALVPHDKAKSLVSSGHAPKTRTS